MKQQRLLEAPHLFLKQRQGRGGLREVARLADLLDPLSGIHSGVGAEVDHGAFEPVRRVAKPRRVAAPRAVRIFSMSESASSKKHPTISWTMSYLPPQLLTAASRLNTRTFAAGTWRRSSLFSPSAKAALGVLVWTTVQPPAHGLCRVRLAARPVRSVPRP